MTETIAVASAENLSRDPLPQEYLTNLSLHAYIVFPPVPPEIFDLTIFHGLSVQIAYFPTSKWQAEGSLLVLGKSRVMAFRPIIDTEAGSGT